MAEEESKDQGVQTPLVMEQKGEVAIVATVPDPDGVRVVCILDCRNPRAPRVVEVTVTGRPLDRKALRGLVPPVQEVEDLPTIKVGTLRGFTIGDFEAAARSEVDDYQSMLVEMGQLLGYCKKSGFGGSVLKLPAEYKFRTWRDQSAAIRKAVAAWYWSYEAHDTEHLAEMFDITPTAGKMLIAQARKANFLLPGTPGKSGAGMTEEGMAFLIAVIDAWKKYEGGLA